jgi:hypothetical protein
MATEAKARDASSRTRNAKIEHVTSTDAGASEPVGIYIEPSDLRARSTGLTDLATGSIFEHARDEALCEVLE